jgi:hypothetical protein
MSNLTILDADDDTVPNFERIDRSSRIEPGHYWRCTEDIAGINVRQESSEFTFFAGSTYLLTKLEFFDGKLHSMVLLDDPDRHGGSGRLTLPLLLAAFEQVTDGEATRIRDAQIAQVQALASDIQREMAEAQINPALMQPAIEKDLALWEREMADRNGGDGDKEIKANLPALSTNGSFSLTAAITHKITSTDIAVFRHMAQREGKIAEIRGKWFASKVEDLGRVLKCLAPFYTEQAAIGIARAQDAFDLTRDVEKGLRSLRLYTGEGVSVNTIVEGRSAASDMPLTLYQRKLFMDEEFAVWDDVDRLFDHTSTDIFFKALAENESLRRQLIPAERGAVAMAVRRNDVNYSVKSIGEALEAAGRNKENKALFLLVRDGENWHQVYSDEPSHELAPRLFPTRNEMDAIFNGFDGDKIGFEDLRFTNRANEFDRKSLTYKRFLILACGLDHRMKLFGHFYPEHEALSFISMQFQAKHMRFVADDDGDMMLCENVGDVHDFISHNHKQLAAGCRVLAFSKELMIQEAAPGAFGKGVYDRQSGRTHFGCLVKPREKALLLTVYRDKDDLVVYLPVRRRDTRVYSGNGQARDIKRVEYEVRVALNKINRLGGGLGYLVTDIVNSDELRPFIYSRATRASYLDYLYGFKLAIPILKGEESARAPVMAQLLERAVHHFGLTSAQATVAALSAIHTWREKHPKDVFMPRLDAASFPDLDFELAEAAYAFNQAMPKIADTIKKMGGKLLRLMRAKKGQLVAYYAQPDSERDLRIHVWEWVGRRVFSPAGKETITPAATVLLKHSQIVGESELFCSPEAYFAPAGLRESPDNTISFLNKAIEATEILEGAFKGERQGVSDRAWLALTAQDKSHRDDLNRAQRNTEILVVVGVATRREIALCLRVKVYDLLYFYGSDAQRAVLAEQGYTLPKKEKWHKREGIAANMYFSLIEDGYCRPSSYIGPIRPDGWSGHSEYCFSETVYEGTNRLNQVLQDLMLQTDSPKQKQIYGKWFDPSDIWFSEGIRDSKGAFHLSEFFPGMEKA